MNALSVLCTLASDDQFLPGAYARNLLIAIDSLQYEEPIILPSTLKASKKWQLNDPSHSNYKEYWLKVYPNPADHYFIVEYRTIKSEEQSMNLSITLDDLNGHEIMKYLPYRNFDQFVITTENLAEGMYFIELKKDNKSINQVKLIIRK
jgi:hypothetical protein